MYRFEEDEGTRYVKAAVRDERALVGEPQVVAYLKEASKVAGAYHRRRREGPVDDAFLEGLADHFVAVSRRHPNVVHVDRHAKPTRSVARKGRVEAFAVVVEPSKVATYLPSRVHFVADRNSATWTFDDSRMDFVPHVAERMMQRAAVRGDAMRRTALELHNNAGLLALGARLWSTFDVDETGFVSVLLPVAGGVVMGTISRCQTGNARAEGYRIGRDGGVPHVSEIPALALCPRSVHEPRERQAATSFTAMTFVGSRDMSDRKARVRALFADLVARHPVVPLVGMSYMWPESRFVADAMDGSRAALAKAYEDLADLHRDPDVMATFRQYRHRRPPPLPWEERPGDVRPRVDVVVPRWRTAGEYAAALETARAGLRAARHDGVPAPDGAEADGTVEVPALAP